MHRLGFGFALAIALLGAGGCSTEGGDYVAGGFDDSQVVGDFSDEVVVATYGLLAARIEALELAVDDLAEAATADHLAAAQQAWIAARSPWEQSEGFLFGPVDTFGYDPALDSWPVNRTDLDAVLASGEPFTAEYVANLQETQKGFHTIEYLLFGEGNTKTAAELTAREIEYLVAITGELSRVARSLEASWIDGVDGRPPYRDVFATAGQSGNTAYPSLTSAAQEILHGMIGICDEVANGKIADPYDAHDSRLVESQFSFNSIRDFQDNLRSVQNAYLGGVPDAATSGRGLSSFVRELDPDLDARFRAELEAAIDAIGAIPDPFLDAIVTESAYGDIERAQQSVRAVQTTLELDITRLVLP